MSSIKFQLQHSWSLASGYLYLFVFASLFFGTYQDLSYIFEMGELLELPVPAFDLLVFQAPEPVEAEGLNVQ